jgi:hypothetical protein
LHAAGGGACASSCALVTNVDSPHEKSSSSMSCPATSFAFCKTSQVFWMSILR